MQTLASLWRKDLHRAQKSGHPRTFLVNRLVQELGLEEQVLVSILNDWVAQGLLRPSDFGPTWKGLAQMSKAQAPETMLSTPTAFDHAAKRSENDADDSNAKLSIRHAA